MKDNTIDNFDLFLIREIFEREITATRILAKSYFFKDLPEDKIISRTLDIKESLVNSRMRKLIKMNLVLMTLERKPNTRGRLKKEYILNEKNIRIGKHKFPEGFSKAIFLKIDNSWRIFQIS